MLKNSVALLGVVLLIHPTTALDRIVGGRRVTCEEFPYQLNLRYNGKPICGAVLISLDTGLTVAHCIPKRGSYSVRAGSDNSYKGGVIAYVKYALVHPSYVRGKEDFDIAILKFFEPLRYSDKIRPASLPNQDDELPPGTKGYISGWGSMSSYFPFAPDELRAVEVPILSSETCLSSYRRITERMFCAGYREGGRDSCQGDSGGPFVVNGTLYGLVSWGFNCAQPGYPGVYTRIAALRNYIRANTGV